LALTLRFSAHWPDVVKKPHNPAVPNLIGLSADFDNAVRAVTELKDVQLPFAIARTLTFLAQDGQAASLGEIESGVFKLRNDWTTRNTKITPATKQTMQSEVYTDTGNRSTGAPDYMERQEDGGERVPVNGRRHIAIPTKYLRQMTGNGPIPAELRPKAMLAYAQQGGKRLTKGGKLRGVSGTIHGMYFFLVPLKSGGLAILARQANDARENAYPMYILVTKASVRKRIHLDDDVEEAIRKNLDRRFQMAAAETMMNDALRGSGLSVKF
jgi:hypothetical protein